MSRPSSSVPRGKPSEPKGRRRFRIEPLNGSYGAISGAKMAMNTTASSTSRHTTVTLSRISRKKTLFQ